MEWPHDPDGEEGSEGKRVYGQAIFAKKVENPDDFPLDFEAFAEEIGHHPIRIDHELVVAAADILEHVSVDRVDKMTEFHRAIGKAMREAGYWPYDVDSEVPA